jgi:hypothetical protein
MILVDTTNWSPISFRVAGELEADSMTRRGRQNRCPTPGVCVNLGNRLTELATTVHHSPRHSPSLKFNESSGRPFSL